MSLRRHTGPREHEVLTVAADTYPGVIMIDPKNDNARWCAAKRLVKRGMLDRITFGNSVLGSTVVYKITDAGFTAFERGPGPWNA